MSHSLQDLSRLIKKAREQQYFIYFENKHGNQVHRQGLSRMAYEQRLSYEIKGLVAWIEKDE